MLFPSVVIIFSICSFVHTDALSNGILNRRHFSLRSTLSMTGTTDSHFDYLVIGAGSGGMASARRAASYGVKVGVIEKSALGGTCVNLGCVPKKIMFNAATVNEIIHSSQHFGIKVEGSSFNWNYMKTARDAYILRLNGIYARNLGNSKIEIIDGYGSFDGANSVTVGDKTFTADNICIAVGGKPTMPAIPGIEHCISSDGFFALDQQPRSVAVIGGGYVGVELAGVFHGLGTKTDLFVRGPIPLKNFDSMIVDTLLSEMKKQGLGFNPNQSPVSVRKEADGTLFMMTESGKEFGPFDQILFATGREPLVGQ
jgi:glutathione reductase (NADPH)